MGWVKQGVIVPRASCCGPTTVAWLPSQHGNGTRYGNRIKTRGATRDHSACDHGGFDAVHDDTLSRPLTAESITNLRRPILLRSIDSSNGPSLLCFFPHASCHLCY